MNIPDPGGFRRNVEEAEAGIWYRLHHNFINY